MKTLLITLILSVPSSLMMAQTRNPDLQDKSSSDGFYMEGSFSASSKHKDMSPLMAQYSLGWLFPNSLYTFARADFDMGQLKLANESFARSYNSIDFGVGLGYKLYKPQNPTRYWVFNDMSAYAFAGTTIGKSDWSYNIYELGLTLGFKKRNSPTFSFGYRHMHSRTNGINNYQGFFATMGFKL